MRRSRTVSPDALRRPKGPTSCEYPPRALCVASLCLCLSVSLLHVYSSDQTEIDQKWNRRLGLLETEKVLNEEDEQLQQIKITCAQVNLDVSS